jgi:hypothetical protein
MRKALRAERTFTPLESPGIYAGDVINRKHQLLVKAGSKSHLSNGVYLVEDTLPINRDQMQSKAIRK